MRLVVSCMLIVVVSQTALADKITINLGYAAAEASTYGVLATKFEQLAEQCSGGSIDVKVRCCGQLMGEDDIYDFEWDTDFSFTIPAAMPSGIYVMRIECGDYADAMPFYVCATLGKPTAKLCVLISTFTYSVYGNHARSDYQLDWQERINDWSAYPYNPAEYKQYGLSTYNHHLDGSGICHASLSCADYCHSSRISHNCNTKRSIRLPRPRRSSTSFGRQSPGSIIMLLTTPMVVLATQRSCARETGRYWLCGTR